LFGHWAVVVAFVVVALSGGELSLAGVLVAWLSFAGASMMTVRVDVAVRPFWSVVRIWSYRSVRSWPTVLHSGVKPEAAFMVQVVSPLVLTLSLFLVTAVGTHLVMSFGQTLIHYRVAHHPIGGAIFRNHNNFHHTHYSDGHLVSRTYLGDKGNTTPYFLIPILVVGGCAYFLLPLNLFVVMVVASAASFYAHIFFDKEYHSERSRLQDFAWFRRKQELHFVHHRHADSNFAVIHFFWDRILGTYRRPNAG
jgi:sterol desaturase/sphingolipid hydroxylase (fatty acid hydroxylase superfamily)